MTLAANPDGIYGWQVRVKTLAAKADIYTSMGGIENV